MQSNPPTNIPAPPQQNGVVPQKKRRRAKKRKRGSVKISLLIGIAAAFILSTCAAVTLAGLLLFGMGRVTPGVEAMGLDLGGMTEAQAADALQDAMQRVTLRDGERVFSLVAATSGIAFDPVATAANAADQGMGPLFGGLQLPAVVSINQDDFSRALQSIQNQIEQPAKNATIRLVDGQVEAVSPVNGRLLDIPKTVTAFAANPAVELMDGTIDLQMREVAPAVTDATPLLQQASTLLASPLRVRVYNPITDQTDIWEASPAVWGEWIIPQTSEGGGISLALDNAAVESFLQSQQIASGYNIQMDEAVQIINSAVAALNPNATIRIYQQDRIHTVQAGETITSIAWDYGVPYPYIQQANPGVDALTAGMQLTVPSADNFLDFPVVYDKRIVVSISGQWTKVYEDGSLKWDWKSSTGINSSPTWPGIYQIISHEPNAYAANWDLYMPNFMGVYRPIPGSDFTNGFHGFPTRGGGQLLWENSIGTRVTYGCILLSNTNAELLYNWAEEGVVVEILP